MKRYPDFSGYRYFPVSLLFSHLDVMFFFFFFREKIFKSHASIHRGIVCPLLRVQSQSRCTIDIARESSRELNKCSLLADSMH